MSALPPRGRGRGRPRGRGGPRSNGAASAGPSRAFASSQHLPNNHTEDLTPFASGLNTPSEQATQPRFRDFSGLSPDLLRTLPFEHCTEVQAATLPTILANHDVLAQAKTGTGKTLAFLIPAIQRLISSPIPSSQHTSILVLSPTRELAQQIGVVAETLLAGYKGKYAVRCVVGGTNMQRDVKDLTTSRADVLVATPGRLVDLLENGGIKPRLTKLGTLVLDEADRLLDAGFRRELLKILESLPDRRSVPRQTLLFSATIPKEVHTIASLALNKDHKFITTLTEADQNTHEHVRQDYMVVSAADIIPATTAALRHEEEKATDGAGFKGIAHYATISRRLYRSHPFIVIVFLPTARGAAICHDIFASMRLPYPVWEIHSRMSQSKRTSTTEEFRKAQRGVLFSSDVTARGIDIKEVTAVMQIGLPSSADQYVHRLGRTARAGAEGHGILILGDFESFFLHDKTIQSFNLNPYPTIDLSSSRSIVSQALASVPTEAKAQAYQAWLGYYNSHLKSLRWSQADLVRNANEYASVSLGYGPEVPGLQAKTVGKMGLKGVPGIRVVRMEQGDTGHGRGGGKEQVKRGREAEGGELVNGRGTGQGGSAVRRGGFGGGGGGGTVRGGFGVRGGRGGMARGAGVPA